MASEDVKIAFDFDDETLKSQQKAVAAEDKVKELSDRLAEIEAKIKNEEWDRLGADIHVINKDKGFWGPPEMMDKWVAKAMLIVTEVSEVVEALRKSKGSLEVTKEFCDIFIRALDLFFVLVEAGEADPMLYKVLHDKIEENRNRPPKHGNRWG